MTLELVGFINCKNCSKRRKDICGVSGKKLSKNKISVIECSKFNITKEKGEK